MSPEPDDFDFQFGAADEWGANRPCNWCSMRRLARRHPHLLLSAPHGPDVTAYLGGKVAAVYVVLPARCACDDSEFSDLTSGAGDPYPDAITVGVAGLSRACSDS